METTRDGFLVCPCCKRKTKVKVYKSTVLIEFPLWCHWCKREFVIDFLSD